MSDRRGVMMLLFDLPVREREERRSYTQFRKAIIRRGYRFFQRSVYIKLLRNISSADSERAWVDQHGPKDGQIHVMSMNLYEFRSLTAVRGEAFDVHFFADDVIFVGTSEEDEEVAETSIQEETELGRRLAAVLGEDYDEPEEPGDPPDWIFTYGLPF